MSEWQDSEPRSSGHDLYNVKFYLNFITKLFMHSSTNTYAALGWLKLILARTENRRAGYDINNNIISTWTYILSYKHMKVRTFAENDVLINVYEVRYICQLCTLACCPEPTVRHAPCNLKCILFTITVKKGSIFANSPSLFYFNCI